MVEIWKFVPFMRKTLKQIKYFPFRLFNSFKPIQEFRSYEYNLSVVAIVKDEAQYLLEWFDFYRVLGISHIYLYDNGSTDHTKELIDNYSDPNFITYTSMPGIAMQYKAYEDAISRFKYETKYMAFIDADEFLMPCRVDSDICKVVDSIFTSSKHIGGIAVNWRMYGSNGHVQKPKGLVLENYLYRDIDGGRGNACIKTIANPRLVVCYKNAHYPIYRLGFYSVNELGHKCKGAYNFEGCSSLCFLRINHYFTKSKNEWMIRRSRRVADKAHGETRSIEQLEQDFKLYDNNIVRDDIGLYYAKLIHTLRNKL
ncbi:glycosyltransferase family 92 protein [Bifidobacterium olomucense]|uniref:Glycosyl transferase 2 n=1 Tax=Bifidobacterium olomucense TaxID=2675324 RepID=A0A7Y0EZI3_9BIFI|nr:glycosyltransferase family 92 protein [Bifidobacterium sp. DSM 109959]NMM99261.1 glycosyl transferase 2 [Bifidobacterium sp. DSM 109959]